MSDETKAALVITAFLAVLMGGFLFFMNWRDDRLDVTCSQRFGREWTGNAGYYGSHDICKNPDGAVKYP